MPGMASVQYVAVIKLLTAASALGVAVLCDQSEGEEAEEAPPAVVSISTIAETEELTPTTYTMLDSRTSTAAPNKLRPSVEIKEKSQDQLFADRQKGSKVVLPGDSKTEKDCTAIIGGPCITNIIKSLGSSKENEISCAHRHLRELQHPTKGGNLPKPTKEVEKRLDFVADVIGEEFEKAAIQVIKYISWFKCPEKWSETMKDEMPEKAEQALQSGPDPADKGTNPEGWLRQKTNRILKGFVKRDELCLAETKHARGIGDLGPVSNMEDAMSICPLENLMKEKFPHLITKKLTLEQCDDAMAELLKDMRKNGLKPESDDYSAMDSSWTLNDRRRLRGIATKVLKHVEAYLQKRLRNFDHVLDAHKNIVASYGTKQGVHQESRKIKWCMSYITLLMSPQDSILFSGERMTSLMNRWLVLMLECAEDVRCLGEVEGKKAIIQTLAGKRRTTIGDGDDNLQGITPGRYQNKQERIERFAEYFKLLDVCSAEEETTDAEVLSRYHVLCGNRYIHVGKLERNMGRLIAYKIKRPNVPADQLTTSLTQSEVQMICTDIWQRVISLKSTLVVRHFARAVFLRFYKQIKSWDAGTVYSDDDKRKGLQDGDKSLSQCLAQINDEIANAPFSPWAMVKVSHFKNIKDLTPNQIKRLKKEWAAADKVMSEAEIGDKHMLRPESFFEDFPISSDVSRALGLTKECIDVALKREKLQYADFPAYRTTQGAPPSRPGELADVRDPSSTGGVENTHANPVCETEVYDISSDDDDTTETGVPSGATGSAGLSKPNLSNVRDRLRSGMMYLSSMIRKQEPVVTRDDDIELGERLLTTTESHEEHAAEVQVQGTWQTPLIPVQAQQQASPTSSLGGWEIGSDHDVTLSRNPSSIGSQTGSQNRSSPSALDRGGGVLKFLEDDDDPSEQDAGAGSSTDYIQCVFCKGCSRTIPLLDSFGIPLTQTGPQGEVTVDYRYCYNCYEAIHTGQREPTAECLTCDSTLTSLLDWYGLPGHEKYCQECDTTETRVGNTVYPPIPTRGGGPPIKLGETLVDEIKSYLPKCRIKEVGGNLFDASNKYSLCHCVSKDLAMSAGIATQFLKRFGGKKTLLAQRAKVGESASLGSGMHSRGKSSIYYLVTKQKYHSKPTLPDLKKSLEFMRAEMREKQETNLAMPRIGCGLDQLAWRDVKDLLFEVFKNDNFNIIVYTQKNTEATPSVEAQNFRQTSLMLRGIHDHGNNPVTPEPWLTPQQKQRRHPPVGTKFNPAAEVFIPGKGVHKLTAEQEPVEATPKVWGPTPKVTNVQETATMHYTENFPVLRAASPSRNEIKWTEDGQAVDGLVERGLARTKCRGQQENMAERRGNSCSPDKVQIEPSVSPKTPTAPPGLLVEGDLGHQVAGGSRCSHTAIVDTGHKTHGAKQADKRDGVERCLQANASIHLPGSSNAHERDGLTLSEEQKEIPVRKATRRGNKKHSNKKTTVASTTPPQQQKNRGVVAPAKNASSKRVWQVKQTVVK